MVFKRFNVVQQIYVLKPKVSWTRNFTGVFKNKLQVHYSIFLSCLPLLIAITSQVTIIGGDNLSLAWGAIKASVLPHLNIVVATTKISVSDDTN